MNRAGISLTTNGEDACSDDEEEDDDDARGGESRESRSRNLRHARLIHCSRDDDDAMKPCTISNGMESEYDCHYHSMNMLAYVYCGHYTRELLNKYCPVSRSWISTQKLRPKSNRDSRDRPRHSLMPEPQFFAGSACLGRTPQGRRRAPPVRPSRRIYLKVP